MRIVVYISLLQYSTSWKRKSVDFLDAALALLQIVENLRLMEEHEDSTEKEVQTSSTHFETARQLFVEQLKFLDSEK